MNPVLYQLSYISPLYIVEVVAEFRGLDAISYYNKNSKCNYNPQYKSTLPQDLLRAIIIIMRNRPASIFNPPNNYKLEQFRNSTAGIKIRSR